jgi:hypothetical protein
MSPGCVKHFNQGQPLMNIIQRLPWTSEGKGCMLFKLSKHAKEEMEKRSISLALLESVINNPRQIVPEREKAYQSIVIVESKESMLLRVIVDDAVEPAKVVIAYKTRKISKYWRMA